MSSVLIEIVLFFYSGEIGISRGQKKFGNICCGGWVQLGCWDDSSVFEGKGPR